MRKGIVGTMALAGLLSCGSAGEAADWVEGAVWYGGGHAIDLGSTAYFRARGRCEGNEFLQSADGCGINWGKAIALKTAQAAVLTWADHELGKAGKKGNREAKWLKWAIRIGFAAYHVRVAVDNLQDGRERGEGR